MYKMIVYGEQDDVYEFGEFTDLMKKVTGLMAIHWQNIEIELTFRADGKRAEMFITPNLERMESEAIRQDEERLRDLKDDWIRRMIELSEEAYDIMDMGDEE